MAVFVCIILIIFKANLISIFNSNEDVIKIGSDYLMTLGPFFIFIATSFILTSAIRGAGDSVFALISSMISLWLARIPTAYVLSKLVGVNGIWMGIPIGWFVGLIVTGTYYKKGRWKTKCVIKKSVNDFSLEPEIASDSTK
jgi:Na+-driven multidrug efflux pump